VALSDSDSTLAYVTLLVFPINDINDNTYLYTIHDNKLTYLT
jgi:hypothetical protein